MIERSNTKAGPSEELMIDVYPSTTVRELRAVVRNKSTLSTIESLLSFFKFEYSHKIRPVDQYWFVNGHLAYDSSSMKDLDVMENTLFALFVI